MLSFKNFCFFSSPCDSPNLWLYVRTHPSLWCKLCKHRMYPSDFFSVILSYTDKYIHVYIYIHTHPGAFIGHCSTRRNENAHIFFCIWFFSTSTLYRNPSESTGKPLIILFHGCILSHDVGITIYSAIPLLLDHLFISRLFSFWEEG